MPLIDRYLQAVRSYLPAARQDDIIRELSDDLNAQVADREEELGRPLTEGEQEALIEKLGHPLMFAAKYRSQQHLIGPALFPVYWQTLKLALGGALIVHLAFAVAMVVSGTPANRVIGPLATFPFVTAVTVFGWITLAFAVLDLNVGYLTRMSCWNPRSLSKLPEVSTEARSRWTLLAEIVGSTVFLGWWLAVPQFPFLIFGPAAGFLALAPVWDRVHVAIAVIWIASLAVLWTALLRPEWARFRVVARIITDGFGLVVALVLLRADRIVRLAPGVDPAADAARAVDAIDAVIRVGVLIAAIVAAWQLALGLYRLRRPPPVGR